MILRGLVLLTILSNCVLSLPLTPSQPENEDVKVMKCIVEALADVLSRPRPLPVTQECLVTLKADDRLVAILRHHNFLKELQKIAVQGGQERAGLQRDTGATEPTTQTLPTAGDDADRSMLEALGGPGERSILSQRKRAGNGDGGEEKDESPGNGETQQDNDIAEEAEVKRGNEESQGSHIPESVEESSEGKEEKREEEEEEEEGEEDEKKREDSEEEIMTKAKKGVSGEKRDSPRNKKKFEEEDGEEEEEKRSALLSKIQEEEEEEREEEEGNKGQRKRGSRESLKPSWTKRGKASSLKEKSAMDSKREVPYHWKEVAEGEKEEEKKKKRGSHSSPEEELQMMAKRGPEEEEGSASRKSEEPEIESLAAIESELETVAQKLHDLRRG